MHSPHFRFSNCKNQIAVICIYFAKYLQRWFGVNRPKWKSWRTFLWNSPKIEFRFANFKNQLAINLLNIFVRWAWIGLNGKVNFMNHDHVLHRRYNSVGHRFQRTYRHQWRLCTREWFSTIFNVIQMFVDFLKLLIKHIRETRTHSLQCNYSGTFLFQKYFWIQFRKIHFKVKLSINLISRISELMNMIQIY